MEPNSTPTQSPATPNQDQIRLNELTVIRSLFGHFFGGRRCMGGVLVLGSTSTWPPTVVKPARLRKQAKERFRRGNQREGHRSRGQGSCVPPHGMIAVHRVFQYQQQLAANLELPHHAISSRCLYHSCLSKPFKSPWHEEQCMRLCRSTRESVNRCSSSLLWNSSQFKGGLPVLINRL